MKSSTFSFFPPASSPISRSAHQSVSRSGSQPVSEFKANIYTAEERFYGHKTTKGAWWRSSTRIVRQSDIWTAGSRTDGRLDSLTVAKPDSRLLSPDSNRPVSRPPKFLPAVLGQGIYTARHSTVLKHRRRKKRKVGLKTPVTRYFVNDQNILFSVTVVYDQETNQEEMIF